MLTKWPNLCQNSRNNSAIFGNFDQFLILIIKIFLKSVCCIVINDYGHLLKYKKSWAARSNTQYLWYFRTAIHICNMHLIIEGRDQFLRTQLFQIIRFCLTRILMIYIYSSLFLCPLFFLMPLYFSSSPLFPLSLYNKIWIDFSFYIFWHYILLLPIKN